MLTWGSAGFGGHYTNKASATREGEATFYRTSRFQLAARKDLMLKDCFKDLLQPPTQSNATDSQAGQRAQRHARFEPMLRSSPQLQQVLQGVATIAQMTILEPIHNAAGKAGQDATAHSPEGSVHPQEGSICVVNTHFFFHPNASHVRNMHTAAIMSEVQAFMQEQSSQVVSCDSHGSTAVPSADQPAQSGISGAAESSSDCRNAFVSGQAGSEQQPALVFSGDLNSDLNDGTPGTPCQATAGRRHADSLKGGSTPRPALLFCGDLNCGLNHGVPGSTHAAGVEQGHLLRSILYRLDPHHPISAAVDAQCNAIYQWSSKAVSSRLMKFA